jgi:hypothetical protein
MPERDVVFDFMRGRFRVRIVPGRIFINFFGDDDVVVTCFAFPGTDAVRAAIADVLTVDGVGGEVMIAFDYDRLIAFREHYVMPGCFQVETPLLNWIRSLRKPRSTRRDSSR